MTRRQTAAYGCPIVLIIAVFLYFYASPLVLFFNVRSLYRNSPAMWAVPIALVPASEPAPPATKLNYFGYEFESPTSETREQRTFASGAVLRLSNCSRLTIVKPSADQDVISRASAV